MKNLYKLLTITALLLSTCTVYLNEQDAGTVAITIGGGGRTAAPERFGEIDLDDLEHTIQVLDKNGAEQYRAEKLRYGETRSITLPPGLYTFNIKAFYNDELKAEGREDRTIHSGKNPAITIKMVPVAPATGKTLTGITAVYEPTTAIFPDTTLLTLKEGLTVTAVYNDGSEKELEADDYELSGDLTEGESVITVTYTEGGVTKTGTFTVTVGAPHQHNWSKISETAATCTTAGVEVWECTAITPSHTEDRPGAAIDSNAHDWNTAYTTTTAATATTDGTEAQTCKNDPSHTQNPRTLWATGTAGLSFSLYEDEDDTECYSVSRGSATGTIYIPAYHRTTTNYEDYKPVTLISNNGFYSASITALTIPASVTTIREYAFYNCASLATVTFAANSQLETIGNHAFDNCTSLASITLPASVTTIGEAAFYESGLTSITIPASVMVISYQMFYNCTSLISVTIPEGVSQINQGAFRSCTSLASVTIPASVTSIANLAFYECSSLASVTFNGMINTVTFGTTAPFPGDLRDKYFNASTGGIGTYTTSNPGDSPTWTKQP